MTEVDLYEKRFEGYLKRCTRVLDRYLDKKSEAEDALGSANFLWAGMAVLGPATYSKRLKPNVERRFKDKDDVSRVACILEERCLDSVIDCRGFDRTMKKCRLDFLLLARAVGWVRYVPVEVDKTATIHDAETGQPKQTTYRDVAYEKLYLDYIHRSDFGHTSGARSWDEVTAVWKKIYLSREQLVTHFGEEIGGKVPLNYTPSEVKEKEDGRDSKYDHLKKALVYEIWDDITKKAMWFTKGYQDGPLREVEDPLGLSDRFFPCAEPAFGTLTNDNLIPMPDASMVEAIYDEIDWLTKQISECISMVKVVGAFDEQAEELVGLLRAENGTMVGVKNWMSLRKQKGGTNSLFEVLEIGPVVTALQVLVEAREAAKQLLYEVTGSSDILRGATNPNETATAQSMKGQYASMRLSEKRDEFARFASDNIRIMGEIIAEKFHPQTIAMMANVAAMDPSEQQLFEPAIALLRQDSSRGFRIEIEAGPDTPEDEQAERDAVGALLESVGSLLDRALPVMQQFAPLGPVIIELIMLAVRQHHVASSLEDNLEAALKKLVETAQQPAGPPPPDPKAMEVQQKGQQAQVDAQMKYELEMQKIQARLQEAQMSAEAKNRETDAKFAMHQEEMRQEAEKTRAELAIQVRKMIAELIANERKTNLDTSVRVSESAAAQQLERERMERDAELERERMAQAPAE